MTHFKPSAALFALLFAASYAALLVAGAVTIDECTTGQVCCADCTTVCRGLSLACFQNCKSPCIPADVCAAVGMEQGEIAGALACAFAKDECNVKQQSGKAASRSVDFTGCCLTVLDSCAKEARNFDCSTTNFGTCTKDEFFTNFNNAIDSVCKTGVCRDAACRDIIGGDPRCA